MPCDVAKMEVQPTELHVRNTVEAVEFPTVSPISTCVLKATPLTKPIRTYNPYPIFFNYAYLAQRFFVRTCLAECSSSSSMENL